jgi:hypothetical protein
MPQLLGHGASVFKVISKRPAILTSECRALSNGAITTYFKCLRFDVASPSGAKLMTSRMLSESTTTRLPQLYIDRITIVTLYSTLYLYLFAG